MANPKYVFASSTYNEGLFTNTNMHTQKRIFGRELIRKVNQDMVNHKPVDTSGLPPRVVQSIRASRFSREEINRAFANARKHVAEAA